MPLPDLNSLNPQVSQSYSSEKRFPLKPIIIILVAVLLLGGGYYIFNKFSLTKTTPTQETFQKTDEQPPSPGVIAKVGDELIYQRDLDLELVAYPPLGSLEERKIFLLEKIATDSAILQSAKKDGLIKQLDATIFNSEDKDYLKRIKIVEDVKNTINSKTDQIKGTIISIWFYNFGKVGSLGYDRGKEFALEKITKLHNDVKSGKMTINQAAEAIRNDSSLAQIDESYKSNAQYDFIISPNQDLTGDKDFDKFLQTASKNQVSDIYLLSEFGFDKPGYYQFGLVKENNPGAKIKNLDDWIKDQTQKYEKIIY